MVDRIPAVAYPTANTISMMARSDIEFENRIDRKWYGANELNSCILVRKGIDPGVVIFNSISEG